MESLGKVEFVKDILLGLHLNSTLVDYGNQTIPHTVDKGLRALIYQTKDYAKVLTNSFKQVKDNTIYRFFDEYNCCYLFLKIPNENKCFFVGPYLNAIISEKSILRWLENKQSPDSIKNQVIAYYNGLPLMEEENLLLSVMSALGKSLWGSIDSFSMEYIDYSIPDNARPIEISQSAGAVSMQGLTLTAIEQHYANERILMQAVSKGELHKVNAITPAVFNNGTEERLPDSLRNRKNYLIILNTLLRKAVEKGGVHPYHIHIFSSSYAKKIEEVLSIEESLNLQSEMIREYCLLVRHRSIKDYSFYVGKAMTLISYDLTADLTLKSIAEKLKVNSSYLSSLFSKECGCTLTSFVTDKRLEEAVRLLLTTNKTVLEISAECGFNDCHYFIRCFKKKTGLTPLIYREKNFA